MSSRRDIQTAPSRRTPRGALLVVVALLFALLPLSAAGAASGEDRDVVVLGTDARGVADAVRRAGGQVALALPVIGGVSASLNDRQITLLRGRGFAVAADAPLAVAGADFDASTTAEAQVSTLEPADDWGPDAGAGVGVALIDTGVTEVAGLAGRVVHGPDLSGEGTTDDTYGHGTFMAGLIAGSSEPGSPASRDIGVAPGASVVSLKVAGADGSTSLSKVIAAIGWAIEHRAEHSIRVVNLSIAAPPLSESYRADPLSAAVEAAWASGLTVVAASGNDGAEVASPGRDPWVITVGALDLGATADSADDTVAPWSNREAGRSYSKPELLAPGVSVVSLAAPGSTVVIDHPGSVIDGHYLRGSGTSMAAALTSGAVAVLTERHAAATPDDFKSALVASGQDVEGEIGRAVRLGAADLVEPGQGGDWWQTHPIAFDGLGAGLSVRMPWATEWAGTRWAGTRWAGTRWAGTRWADGHWAGTRWAGTRWAGEHWAGTRWAEEHWAGTRWAGTRWAGTRWAGTRWAEEQWAGTRWAGTRWAGTRWAGTQWGR